MSYDGTTPFHHDRLGWTDERIAQLKKLWAEGYSASQIAYRLRGVSRNAVIGKLHRLGVGGRQTPSRPIRVAHIRKPRMKKPRVPAPLIASTPLPPPPPVPATALRLTLMQLTDQTCKCGLGDPKEAGFAFCGLPVKEGSRYCAEHHARFYSVTRTENAKLKLRRPRVETDNRFERWAA